MREAVSAAPPLRGERLQSIDLLRGLDVLLMLFVNDIAGVAGTPAFLRHVAGDVDGMTITDVVFPAFLFITGMAIPLAIDGRLRRGDTPLVVWRHILRRALSLIVIGVFMVNAESATPGGLLSPYVWNALMTLALIWTWRAPAPAPAPASAPSAGSAASRPATSRRRAILAGAAVLIALALIYHSSDSAGSGDAWRLLDFRPRWWGILGLIGWAYLPAATLYLWSSRRSAVTLLGAAALMYALRIADRMDALAWLGVVQPYISVALTTHTAIVLSGTALTVMLLRHREAKRPLSAFATPALLFVVALAAAGALIHGLHDRHPAFWFSKIQASVAWGLVSSAITAAAWTLLFALADLRGWRRWPESVTIAGEQALTVYLLAPLLLSLFALSGLLVGMDWYASLGRETIVGFLRAVVFAWLTVRLCEWMRDRGVRLQL